MCIRDRARDSAPAGTTNYFLYELLKPYKQNPYEPFCLNGNYAPGIGFNEQLEQSLLSTLFKQHAQRKLSKEHIDKNANSDLPDSPDDGTAEISK